MRVRTSKCSMENQTAHKSGSKRSLKMSSEELDYDDDEEEEVNRPIIVPKSSIDSADQEEGEILDDDEHLSCIKPFSARSLTPQVVAVKKRKLAINGPESRRSISSHSTTCSICSSVRCKSPTCYECSPIKCRRSPSITSIYSFSRKLSSIESSSQTVRRKRIYQMNGNKRSSISKAKNERSRKRIKRDDDDDDDDDKNDGAMSIRIKKLKMEKLFLEAEIAETHRLISRRKELLSRIGRRCSTRKSSD